MKSDNIKTPVITDLTAKYPEDAVAKLTPAKVKTFKSDKGYGFFDTPTGDVFFHVSRYVELKVDLAALSQQWVTPRGEDDRVIVPTPKAGDKCLIRVVKDRNGRSVAEIWTFQKQVHEQAALLNDELQTQTAFVKNLAILELDLIVVMEGEPYADNATRSWVTPKAETRKTVFHGNSTSALIEAIGYNSNKAKTQRLYLACYDCSGDVRRRIPLPSCKNLEHPVW